MRYAIFSDIQGNRPAWQAVLADTVRLRVDTLVCLGDVVGYGPASPRVLFEIRSRTANLIMGDCEAALAGLLDAPRGDRSLREAIKWNRRRLDPESLQFLAKLPMAVKTDDLLFTHAEALEPSHFGSIDGVEVAKANFAPSSHRLTFVGHGHRPGMFGMDEHGKIEERPPGNYQLRGGSRYIVNVGSVGEPHAPDALRARYVVYDAGLNALFFRAVSFDSDRYRSELIAAGLPLRPWLPQRAADPQGDEPPLAVRPVVAEQPDPRPVERLASLLDLQGPPPPAPIADLDPPPAPRPRRRRSRLAVMVLSALVIVTALTTFVVIKWREDRSAQAPLAGNRNQPAAPPKTSAPGDLPGPGEAEGVAPPANDLPVDPPAATLPNPEPESEPTAVAVVPVSPPSPPNLEARPEPDPAISTPPAGRPPLPPEPENAASTTPLSEGLVFYAPFDEDQNEFTARDLAGGRDLDVAGGLPGGLGQIDFACRLEKENDSEALISEPMALPEIKSITISFWIKHPDLPLPDDPEQPVSTPPGATPAPEPPMNLISLADYCEVRLENHEVVADLDRQGDPARLSLPADFRWHHVLVENDGGRTTIWIDHYSQSSPVSEVLPNAAATSGVLQIGSTAAHFHIDEVAIWNRGFTPDERQILYRNGRLNKPILSAPKVIASWAFDDDARSRLVEDTTGRHPLGIYKAWTSLKGIAPDPVPLTAKPNLLAAKVWQLAERPEDAGSFQMKPDAAFTFEGWMKLGPGSAVILGGTASPSRDEPAPGWRLEARPASDAKGFLAFIHESGREAVQAMAEELPIYDGLAHHFAAVWNPLLSPTHGTMELYLDNELVATASLRRADFGPVSPEPFRILATGAPVVLDELRFSSGALPPPEFLTAGINRSNLQAAADPSDPPPGDESVMARRAREARERREREKEERKARMLEQDEKRKREKLSGE